MSQADQDIAVEASLKTSGLGSAAVVDDGVVPTIDVSQADKAKVAEELWQAATQVGFFSVVGHGIPQSVIDDAFAVSADFFAQPLEDKMKQSPGDMKNNAGFEHFAQVRPSTGVADQKESIQVTARAGVMDGRWPSDNFKDKADALMNAANKLAGEILDLLETKAVPHNKPGTISKSHTLWADDGQCTLRFLHYPALPDGAADKLLEDGYWRAGPHTGMCT
jgi:isopenicillin N synthase-like dioxygenase